ncbi:MAG: spore photoproduct lyase [Firmicutes bacterium HGW-Firmicutes-1]|nr:MAG: spore photoproduct lyase [Firmicutes bacterium HGW-Firmicutes-1]
MFKPERIIFEKDALNYPIGQEIKNYFNSNANIEQTVVSSNRVKNLIPGDELKEQYVNGKKTLVVGVKKGMKFQSCKPSAHYQLPLVSGCMGMCQYCYLNTRLGDRPYIKVHVNIEDILNQAREYTEERIPDITIFEGAATSDPIPLEPYTHSLQRAIEFFGNHEYTRFRFVTKYNDVDGLLDLKHNGHTEIRFSINTDTIIKQYEQGTASRDKRIEASIKMMQSGYPVGFLIAPVFIYPEWQKDYHQLLEILKDKIPKMLKFPITFEIISHRYTTTAKNRILEVFPETTLPMNEEDRKYKHGQFGYGKYIYKNEDMKDIKEFFAHEINRLFDSNEIKYII